MSLLTDIHIHIHPWEKMKPGLRDFLRGIDDGVLDRLISISRDPSLLLEEMDRAGVDRVGLINEVSPEVTGFTEETNAFLAKYAAHTPDRFIPFGSLHARRVSDPEGSVRELIDMGMRGIKIHPPHQGYPANAHTDGLDTLAGIYRAAEKNDLPVMVHTGTSIIPGARNRYGHPMELDDVAVDFPDLPIIMAHGGRPFWTGEAFFVLKRHRNIRLDISSFPPSRLMEYFPKITTIDDRVLWGSDWPTPGVAGLRSNLDAFLELPLPDEWKRRVVCENSLLLFPGKKKDV